MHCRIVDRNHQIERRNLRGHFVEILERIDVRPGMHVHAQRLFDFAKVLRAFAILQIDEPYSRRAEDRLPVNKRRRA